VINYSLVDVDLSFLKVIRIIRVLRPLRVISRNKGLKVVVISLLKAIPGILNILLIMGFFFLLFGILGITFFKGRFYYCETGFLENEYAEIETKWDCLNSGGTWIRPDQNFDNIFNAILTLFNMSTTEGWTGVMWNGVDSSQLFNQAPHRDRSIAYVFYFMIFIIVGSQFFINLFVG